MKINGFQRILSARSLRIFLGGSALAICLFALWVLALDVRRAMERQGAAALDNVQWTLSQVEVDLINLVLAADRAELQITPLADVRLHFDVFFSRIATLKQSGMFAGLRNDPLFADRLAALDTYLARQSPLVDAPDPVLRAGLPKLSADASTLTSGARKLALTGVAYFASLAEQQRLESQHALNATVGLTILLISGLVTLIILLLRLDAASWTQSAQNLQTLSRLDAIVSTAQEAIITVDDGGKIVDFNPAATQTFGYARDEAVGADLADLIGNRSDPQTVFQPGQAPALRGSGQIRLGLRHKSGRNVPVEVSVSQTMAGDRPLYVALLRDLSVQLAAEQAMIAARDEALAGEKAKADLLVVMSHEIRTPLNGMIGTIELLGNTGLAPEQREYLRILEASGMLLMHHVNDVLNIARLDRGKYVNAPSPIDLDNLVQEVLDNQAPAARANANDIRYIGPGGGQSWVVVDGVLLRHVLLNLVGNAVKFTQSGQIVVRISHASASGPTEISVSDTGIGIGAADIDRIFDDFVTLDASYARRSSGTGLGLGIVRRIVGRMGGTLKVDSTPGKGSVFRVILPLQILHRDVILLPAPVAPTLPARPGQVTLVVEDNDFNRIIIRDMLRQLGHEVVEARDGLEGISLAASRRYDLILMDISMPRLDGVQAARAISQGHGLSRDTPILAMTAHAMAEDTALFKAAGMGDALIKPITRKALQRALASTHVLPPRAKPEPASLLLDTAILHEMQTDLGQKRAGELVVRFLTETSQSVEQLVATCRAQGLTESGIREIHRLEGSAAMFGAIALRQTLSNIQTQWKSGATEGAGSILSGLDVQWQQTRQAYSDAGFLPQLSSLR